jgi:hypothetical protein
MSRREPLALSDYQIRLVKSEAAALPVSAIVAQAHFVPAMKEINHAEVGLTNPPRSARTCRKYRSTGRRIRVHRRTPRITHQSSYLIRTLRSAGGSSIGVFPSLMRLMISGLPSPGC